jgi:hypothetical protein
MILLKILLTPVEIAYLRHTYAYFTTITHPLRMPKFLLRIELFH